ncbi:hypothetical protein QEN19_002720 [Hanseniaspora menglaensis]
MNIIYLLTRCIVISIICNARYVLSIHCNDWSLTNVSEKNLNSASGNNKEIIGFNNRNKTERILIEEEICKFTQILPKTKPIYVLSNFMNNTHMLYNTTKTYIKTSQNSNSRIFPRNGFLENRINIPEKNNVKTIFNSSFIYTLPMTDQITPVSCFQHKISASPSKKISSSLEKPTITFVEINILTKAPLKSAVVPEMPLLKSVNSSNLMFLDKIKINSSANYRYFNFTNFTTNVFKNTSKKNSISNQGLTVSLITAVISCIFSLKEKVTKNAKKIQNDGLNIPADHINTLEKGTLEGELELKVMSDIEKENQVCESDFFFVKEEFERLKNFPHTDMSDSQIIEQMISSIP